MTETDRNRVSDATSRSAVNVLLVALLVTIVMRNAWLGDDSFVTFRTIDNWLNGYGLRWNVSERVQGYTHPLWLLVNASLQLVTREVFFTVYGLSIAATAWTGYLLVSRLAVSSGHAVIAVLALCLSRAFIDYSTSGLENPLTHLLLSWLAITFFGGELTRERLRRLMLVSGLVLLNRLDTAWLVLPVLVYGGFTVLRTGVSWRALVGDGVRCFSPVWLWLLFSVVYYGFPFPNTAYAKLNTGIDGAERWYQGFLYGLSTLNADPLSVLCVIAAVGLAWRTGTETRDRIWVSGALLYCVYVMRIGGDFMEGRFFAAPVLVAAVSLARASFNFGAMPVQLASVGALLLIGLSAQHPPPMSDSDYRKEDKNFNDFTDSRGVTDERAFYYRKTGLVMARRIADMPEHRWADEGAKFAVRSRKPLVRNTIGFFGYRAGPTLHIVDQFALTDPLLARLPAKREVAWRSGHFERAIPKGYVDTLHHHRTRFADKKLGRYYDALKPVIAGPIWSWDRWHRIWQLNTGALDELIDVDHYRHPDLVRVGIATVGKPLPIGTAWDAAGTHRFKSSGMEIYLNGVQHNDTVELSVDSGDRYEVVFMRGSWAVASRQIDPNHYGGLYIHRRQVPEAAVTHGYDRIRVLPLQGGDFSLGHLLLK